MRGQQYTDIIENWTLDDLADANEVIDALEQGHAHARRLAEAQAAAARNTR